MTYYTDDQQCDHIYCAICLGKVLCEAGNAGNEIVGMILHYLRLDV